MTSHKPVLLACAITAAAALAPPALPARPAFYWTSYEAGSTLAESEWASRRGIESVSCKGVGSYRREYSSYKFATFRCALKNKQFDLVAYVTLRTTAPESFALSAFKRVRSICP